MPISYRAAFSGNADFKSATFYEDADFDSAAFSGNAYFTNAIFPQGADTTAPHSLGMPISQTPFSLWDAFFDSATFSGATLFQTNLKGAHLQNADVRTVLVDGRVRRTDLSSCSGLAQAQLDIMKGDSGTLLPEGLVHPDHWPELDRSLLEEHSEAIDDASPPTFPSQ